MGFHGISWDFMGFHEISWNFIKCPLDQPEASKLKAHFPLRLDMLMEPELPDLEA